MHAPNPGIDWETLVRVPGFDRSRGSVIPGTEMQGSVIDLLWPIAGVHRI